MVSDAWITAFVGVGGVAAGGGLQLWGAARANKATSDRETMAWRRTTLEARRLELIAACDDYVITLDSWDGHRAQDSSRATMLLDALKANGARLRLRCSADLDQLTRIFETQMKNINLDARAYVDAVQLRESIHEQMRIEVQLQQGPRWEWLDDPMTRMAGGSTANAPADVGDGASKNGNVSGP